jgi:5-methylcytosine-specific restriction endonuclease McrA
MPGVLQEHVLVLNRLWQAVNVCTVERAIPLLFTGHAQVVHPAPDGSIDTYAFRDWCFFHTPGPAEPCIRAVGLRMKTPRIILLRVFDRFPRKDVKFTRHNVFERDEYTCQYCGRRPERNGINLDHVVPRAHGGKTTWHNVVCSCIACNSRKADRTPAEAGMNLLRDPVKPRWRPSMDFKVSSKPVDEFWRPFLPGV